MAFTNTSTRSLEKARKDVSKILGELGLQTTAYLSTGKYHPYRKPDNYPLYINAKSNHPPSMIKHLPATISNRISDLSCDSDKLNKASQSTVMPSRPVAIVKAFNMSGVTSQQIIIAETDQDS